MKTESLPRRSLLALCLGGMLLLAGAPALAQTPVHNAESAAQLSRQLAEGQRLPATAADAARKPQAGATAASPAFEIEINDGMFVRKGRSVEASLANVVDLLRERHNGANIVLSPGIHRIRIPNLKLRATTLEQELEALRVASGNKFTWGTGLNQMGFDPVTGQAMFLGGVTGIDPATGLAVAGAANTQAPLYVLTEAFNSPEARRRVEVFNLSDYFNSLGQDDESRKRLVEKNLAEIQDIVATTLAAVDPEYAASVKFQFHAGANLLVVIGTPEALEVARRVVGALQAQAGAAGGSAYGSDTALSQAAEVLRRRVDRFGVPPANSKERRNIMGKLEGIRLESVLYDGLPLGEVVRSLVESTLKRDPEKRGINFLVNPNQPDSGGVNPVSGQVIPPWEPVDINQVSVKIIPALTNVRLVDLLDAIVRVADRPIQYVVTDYAIVFSLRGEDEPAGQPPVPGAPPGFPAIR